MTRALLKTDEPVAYRVVVTHTIKPEHAGKGFREHIVERFGPYATLSGAKGQATRETGAYSYGAWDSTAVVEAIRAEAWTEVPAQ